MQPGTSHGILSIRSIGRQSAALSSEEGRVGLSWVLEGRPLSGGAVIVVEPGCEPVVGLSSGT